MTFESDIETVVKKWRDAGLRFVVAIAWEQGETTNGKKPDIITSMMGSSEELDMTDKTELVLVGSIYLHAGTTVGAIDPDDAPGEDFISN